MSGFNIWMRKAAGVASLIGLLSGVLYILAYVYGTATAGYYFERMDVILTCSIIVSCVFMLKKHDKNDPRVCKSHPVPVQCLLLLVTGVLICVAVMRNTPYSHMMLGFYVVSAVSYLTYLIYWMLGCKHNWLHAAAVFVSGAAVGLYMLLLYVKIDIEITYYNSDYTVAAVTTVLSTVMIFAIHAALFLYILTLGEEETIRVPVKKNGFIGRALNRLYVNDDEYDELDELYGEDTYEQYVKEKAERRSDRVRSYDEAVKLMDELDGELDAGNITEEEYKKERQNIIDRI